MRFIKLIPSVNVASTLSIAVLTVMLFLLGYNIHREQSSWEWVVHTRQVLERLQGVISLTNEAEAVQRGYLLTESSSYLASYQQLRNKIFSSVEELKILTSDNRVQQENLQQIQEILAQRFNKMDAVIDGKKQIGAINIGTMQEGQAIKKRLLLAVELMRSIEQELLHQRRQTVERARLQLIFTVGVVALVSILLILFLKYISSRDAAEIKAGQEELAAANAYLEQRIEERTEQLSNANRELQGFAHTVAHDLRAPLRNIEGFSTALLEDEADNLTEDGKEFAKRICAATIRMDQLITDLLAYSRLSRTEIRLEPIQLTQVVGNALRDLESEIEASDAIVSVAPSLHSVQANDSILTQVIGNLISNGIKFVAPGVIPKISVSSERKGQTIVCSIEDNGIGINRDHVERIFNVFERLHGQEQYPGTGIGLAIVRKGLERMHGTVEVRGLPTGGTAFDISLPVAA